MPRSGVGPAAPGPRRYWPLLRCLLIFLGLLGLFSLLLEWEPVKAGVIEPFTILVTRVAGIIISVFGPASSSGTFLTYRGTTVDIRNGCNGDVVHVILAAALLGFPTTWRARGWGFLLGMPAVFLVNQVRIVALALIGAHFPGWFDASHVYAGQVVVIIATLILWVLWIEKFAAPRSA